MVGEKDTDTPERNFLSGVECIPPASKPMPVIRLFSSLNETHEQEMLLPQLH